MKHRKTYRTGEKERLEIVERITAIISQEPEIVFAFLHGSFLLEPLFRDIDLGILVRGIDPSGYWDYECKLSHRIEDALHFSFPVELKVINETPLSFCFHVIRGKLLFAQDEGLLVDFMVRIARDYLDIAPLRHHYIKVAMA